LICLTINKQAFNRLLDNTDPIIKSTMVLVRSISFEAERLRKIAGSLGTMK
jgi:hypothetical protein